MYLQDYHWWTKRVFQAIRVSWDTMSQGDHGRESHKLAKQEQEQEQEREQEQAVDTTNATAHQPPTRHTYFGDLVLI